MRRALVVVSTLAVLWSPAALAESGPGRVSVGEMFRRLRDELQVYRGAVLERLGNRVRVGRSDFDTKASVAENLTRLVSQQKLPHYYARVGDKEVLHVVVDLGQGAPTKNALRALSRRVGEQTIELNYKAPGGQNHLGHVAVRVGDGATYDLTGTRGVARLPVFVEKLLTLIRGKADMTFARRRNLRRFMESRTSQPALYYGMLYAASAEERAQTDALYRRRLGQITGFSAGGGEASAGVYSCAQFLTECVPFLNQRGIEATIGARSAASSGFRSPALEAVIVYRAPAGGALDELKDRL